MSSKIFHLYIINTVEQSQMRLFYGTHFYQGCTMHTEPQEIRFSTLPKHIFIQILQGE